MKRLLFTSIMLLLTIAGSLGGGELLVRFSAPQNLTGTWLTFGPHGLVVNRANWTARHQFGEVVVHYRINAFHQRSMSPREDAIPVLVLGDSFTFGWLLDESDTYVSLLQDALDRRFGDGRFQLLNAGTGGWGTSDQLAYLELFGSRLEPRAVVVFVGASDFERSQVSPLYRLTVDGLEARDASAARSRAKLLAEKIPLYPWLLERSHLVQLLRNRLMTGQAALLAAPSGGAGPEATIGDADRLLPPPLAEALMRRMKAWADAHSVPLLVITNGWPENRYRWLDALLAGLGISFVDLVPVVGPRVIADRWVYTFKDEGHPTPRGARLIAEAAKSPLINFLANAVGMAGKPDSAAASSSGRIDVDRQ